MPQAYAVSHKSHALNTQSAWFFQRFCNSPIEKTLECFEAECRTKHKNGTFLASMGKHYWCTNGLELEFLAAQISVFDVQAVWRCVYVTHAEPGRSRLQLSSLGRKPFTMRLALVAEQFRFEETWAGECVSGPRMYFPEQNGRPAEGEDHKRTVFSCTKQEYPFRLYNSLVP